MPGELHSKGVSLRSFLATLERLHGRVAVERTLEFLEDDAREALQTRGVIASGWYPLSWHKQLHACAQRATNQGPELARRIGYEGTKADFRGVYKFVASIFSPQMLLKQAPRVFRTYYDGGDVIVDETHVGSARARFSRCFGFDRNMWQNVLGGIQSTLEIAGATHVNIRIASGGGATDSGMEAEASWS